VTLFKTKDLRYLQNGERFGGAFGKIFGSILLKVANLDNCEVRSWTEEHSRQLKAFVPSAMTATQVPGVSIAVVQGGRMVYAEGFGVRSFGDAAPVTPLTRFMMGSAMKPLTTLMMARLVDQKKLSWSTPVAELLEDFSLADQEITKRLELRHTVSNSTGMPKRDAEFVFRHSGISAQARLAQMKTMRPTTGFGQTFQYSNYLVAAGGYAAARAFSPDGRLEDAFKNAMTELVFTPLGMNDTFLYQDDALQGEAALPHAIDLEGCARAIPLHLERACESVAPAGTAWSTAPDLARYLLLELGRGCMPGGLRLISEETLLERRKKGARIAENFFYGLGLVISEECGTQVVYHNGNTLGFSTDLYFLPEKDLGFVVLTNLRAATYLLTAIRQKIFEIVFGAEPKAEETVQAALKKRAWTAKVNSWVTTDPESMTWIDTLLGTYRSEELGSALIIKQEGHYWVQFDEWTSALGSEISPDGVRLLYQTTPPWCGKKILISGSGELVMDFGQCKYVFRRQ